MDERLHNEICAALLSGLSYLWLEAGIPRAYWCAAYEFCLLFESENGRRLYEWLRDGETLERVE